MITAVVILGAVLGCYFLPTIIAIGRKHSPVQVGLLNLLLGWTFLGWIVALIWAFGSARQTVIYVNSTQGAR